MGAREWVTSISILVTLIIGLLSIGLTLKNNNKNRFVNAVTTERVKWMNKLKELLSDYLTDISKVYTINPQKSSEYINKLAHSQNKIKLELNYKDEKDKEILKYIHETNMEISSYFSSELNMDTYDNNINNIVKEAIENISNLSRSYLKDEWERIKLEAEKGKLKK
ncbi:hypothetical protein SFB99_17575 [Bacillus altitudinis]|uniref:hypothetical protein n=1 Tax=Bacillus altitudinis TaxID=293387 RepID=UPI0007068764|nr:hypothetical protein [Bacillus altitudinis]ALM29136.1 hypothetical protein AKO65_14310 [Bacillus altitudinis]ALM45674.1 hypothetical protein AMR71_10625 [Bacillus altitudinis]ANY97154.1 hypothetical protein AKO66_10630 [Bacillus altitudinis]